MNNHRLGLAILCVGIMISFGPRSAEASKICADLFEATGRALPTAGKSRAPSRFILNENQFSYPSNYQMNAQSSVLVVSSYNSPAVRVLRADGTSFKVSKTNDQPHSTAVSADGTFMAVGYGKHNAIELYRLDSKGTRRSKPFASLQWTKGKVDYKPEVRDLAISPDGNLVVGISYVGEGVIYNRESGQASDFDIGEWSNGITFSDDSATVYIGTRRGKILSLSIASGKVAVVHEGLDGLNQAAGGRLQILPSGVLLVFTPTMGYLIKNKTVVRLLNGTSMDAVSVDTRSEIILSVGRQHNGSFLEPFMNVNQIDPFDGTLLNPLRLEFDSAYATAASSSFVNRKFNLAGLGVGFHAIVPGDVLFDRVPPSSRLKTDDRGRVLLWDLRTGRVFAKLISQKNGREDKTSVQRLFFNDDTGKLVAIHSNGQAYEFDLNGVSDAHTLGGSLGGSDALLQIESIKSN